jgi:sec-independent protein translocase protein TatA
MFGSIGVPELIMIFVVALLLFGPRKLPDIGRSLGKALGEFRRASNDLKRTLEDEVAADQLREVEKDVRSAVYTPPALDSTAQPAKAEQPPSVKEPAGSEQASQPGVPAKEEEGSRSDPREPH